MDSEESLVNSLWTSVQVQTVLLNRDIHFRGILVKLHLKVSYDWFAWFVCPL